MVTIRNIPMPLNMYGLKCPYEMKAEKIVIHNTANVASAKGEIEYMQRTQDYRSFHYAVDDKEAVQGVDLNRNAYHAGDGAYGNGNRKGIAIEICMSYVIPNGMTEAEAEAKWRKEYKAKFEKAQNNAAELCAKIMHDKGWGCDLKRITKHQDYANKLCPHRTLNDYGWDWFLSLVKTKYKEMYDMSKYYKDVKKDAWYADAVDFCHEKGLMNGTGDGQFKPQRTLTRAEMAVVLERLYKKLKG